MNKTQAGKLIAKWQERFGLGEWTIAVLMRKGGTIGEGGDWGRISYNFERLEAVMELPTERTDAEVEHTICHELSHLAVQEYEGIVMAALAGLPKATRTLVEALLHGAEERLCNRIARASSGIMPQAMLDSPEAFVEAGEGATNGN
jgi:hypothetical protein